MVQIAGLVARRIVCFVREGATLGAGERIGMIRFGSRVDVYLPEGARAAGCRGPDRDRRRNNARRSARRRCATDLPRRITIGRAMVTACRWHGGAASGAILPACVLALRARSLRAAKRRRFRLIPVRTLLPNLITLLALCAGLTAIRLAIEEKLEWAVAAIVFAALLDGIDGRIARLLKGTSRFGAELDSLADFVNFGVAPALILYFWGLHELKSAGWIAAHGVCDLRGLAARALQRDDRRSEQAGLGGKFLRRHAGAGGRDHGPAADLHVFPRACRAFSFVAPVILVYTLAIAFLMVSRLPVFSGKRVGKRIAPEMVLPVFVVVVLFFALLVAYPWVVLTIGTVLYLA